MKIANIRYKNLNKNETTDRRVLITKELSVTKPAIVTLDLSDASTEDVEKITAAYNEYEQYLKTIPSFEVFMKSMFDEQAVPVLKHRRFNSEQVSYLDDNWQPIDENGAS